MNMQRRQYDKGSKNVNADLKYLKKDALFYSFHI